MYAGVGAGLFGFHPYSGMVLMRCATARSEELIRAARHNPVVWHWIEYFANSSDTFNLITGHGIMIWAILSSLGRVKGNDAIFQMAGLAEHQVMAPPPGMPNQEELNAYAAATNGSRTN
jgi:hypothetical protein